ncbi:MAG: hypothetical protein DLM52_10155 [Chthoniobacterales bacterium]|nr:MAG: hypothetical protein DLM52_10155 [Chthoniobacterales bacterium]
MVPSRFVWLGELPQTNGKVDRKALEKLADKAITNNHIPPRTELEQQLADIWTKVLQQERIGCHDNFFELGGDSLHAGLIVVEIEKLLGRQLPPSALFGAPTVESLAGQLLPDKAEPPAPSLVTLQPHGSKPPLFIVHGWGGDVFFFHELARLLPDQPCYGLQAQGLDGKAPRHTTIEEMAAHYIEEVRAFQPKGPYQLIGYSLGSLIAFEMAQRLNRLGETVAFLGLLDPPLRPTPWIPYARTLAPHLIRNGRRYVGGWLRSHGRESIHLKRRWRGLSRWLAKNRPRPSVLTAPPGKAVTAPIIPGFRDYYSAAALPYRLRRYPGAIDLIVSDTLVSALLPLWGHLAREGARFHRIACTHRQMIDRKHLAVLATALRGALSSQTLSS